jgi:hypothetical protein
MIEKRSNRRHGQQSTAPVLIPVQPKPIMAHKEAVMIYFDVAGTICTSVNIVEICEFVLTPLW